jgi:hypothetical protein
MTDHPDHQSIAPDFVDRSRLEFAQRAFTNAQELSRMMDQKAGYILSAVGLLTTALGIAAARALDAPGASPLHQLVHAASVVAFCIYTVVAVMVVLYATQVFRASGRQTTLDAGAPGLLFPLMVLDGIRSEQIVNERAYFESLGSVSVQGILRDYAHQVVQVSMIYERKQRLVNRAVRLFQWLALCWTAFMLLAMAHVVMSTV